MVSRVATVAFKGMEAVPVDVQVHMASGVVAFSIVDLVCHRPALQNKKAPRTEPEGL